MHYLCLVKVAILILILTFQIRPRCYPSNHFVEKPENASMSEPFFVPVSDTTTDELLAEAQIPYACAYARIRYIRYLRLLIESGSW